MKTEYTRANIVAFIKNLDTRAQKFTDEKIDDIINRGYAELSTVSKRIFSNEEVAALEPYYESGELQITVDVEEDVTEIYDLYTTIEGDRDKSICQRTIQGIGMYVDNDVAYRDNRYVGRVHLSLDTLDEVFDNVVVKYYYTPTAVTDSVYMDSQTYLAWTDAMWAATNYFLKDIEGEAQKRNSMGRTSKSMTQEPEDIPEHARALFGGFGI